MAGTLGPNHIVSELVNPTRLALLQTLDLLRPHHDASFDRVTATAALATGRPTALITFITPDGQWVASRVGWDRLFHPLSESFCVHTLDSDALLEVCDVTADPRFQGNALVTEGPMVRFYAGQPICFDGHSLGAVCVLDAVPGALTPDEVTILRHLADLVTDLLRVRLERSQAEQQRAKSEALMAALERSEMTLRESEERYRLLWQTTTDAVLIIDDASVIRFANPALQTLFGRLPEDVIGQPLAMLQPARLRSAHDRGLAAYLRTGERRLDWRATETVGLRADGSEVPIEVAFSELEVGGRRHFAAFIRDLSERNRAQQALRRNEAARSELEDHLRQAQKLEAIGVLAGGIAHDFNNIVAGILGNTQLALDDLEPQHAAVQSLQQIRKAGLRGREMVQQILTFARRRPKRAAHCELQELVDETMSLLRPTIPTSVKVQTQLPGRPLRVFADATQVEQALINLCANAWQAMAGRPGRIVIGAEETALDREAAERLGGLAPGRHVHLFVRDDGPGMDEATVKRVFEPFFTTKPEGEGTGLGLSVVHGIVSGHGGAITVDSALGKGTTFHIWLPAGDNVAVTEPVPMQPQPVHGAGRHVMYVDDDEVMTLMVSRLLERSGYRVSAFGHAADALLSFENAPWDVDVVVTDLNMPGLSGLDVLREINAIRPGLPVIIGSGNLPPELLVDAERAGVRATFHKQNTLEELPALLAEVLGL
ncbi:MAG: hybrid sensor histidine kinase/response regulator [Roseateles sp.]|uniref:hybrid sensor histidine kinase/response regulator n=1 Tax=Roseateles sp. TaxID=1971397 RepID=UPI004036F320